jgi:mono/diheme cytochrome c family protein
MIRIIRVGGLLLALFALSFVGRTGGLPADQGTAEEPESQPAPSAPERPKPIVVPEAEKSRKNPVPPSPETIESGRSLFASQCTMCHGAKGNGRGDLAARLKLAVPDFTSARQQQKRTDGELFYILTHGHGEMPPERRLPDQQKWEIIHYIRTLVPAAMPKK